jgi:hypothetical protein
LLCWSLACANAADVPPWSLEQLMASLAGVEAVHVRFKEEKHLAVLDEPLVMSGELRYRAPHYLEKRTFQPHPERYELDGDWLVVETPDQGRRHIALRGAPELRALVEAIRATLAGDLRSLQRYYRVRADGRAEDWTLSLEPVDARVSDYVSVLVIRGRGDRLLSVETREADGDRGLLTLEQPDG